MSADTAPSIDLGTLSIWLQDRDEIPGDGPVDALEPLPGGAQNLLFTLRRTDGTELVLRRPGRHAGGEAAASFVREATVLTALARTDVAHPRLFGHCLDDSVIGAPFSILEKIDGFTPRGQLPEPYSSDPDWRRSMAFELVAGAARLAMVDPGKVGLEDLSRTDDWTRHQVHKYLKMLHSYRDTEGYPETESPAVDPVAAWLRDNAPAAGHIGIVHGDLQFANVMFRHDAPRLAAIVDWEMAALGDPLLDLAWILTAWREEGDPPGSEPYLRPWDGIPGRAELLSRYADLTGRDVDAFPWFQVLACFRLAALLEGTYVRALNGRMSRKIGEGLHDYAGWLWAKAEQEVTRA